MELLNSKYYRPVKAFEEVNIGGTQTFTITDIRNEVNSSATPYTDILDRLYPGVNLNGDEMVINTENLQKLERCTDFNIVSYNRQKQKLYISEACYFHPEFEFFILTDEDLASDYNEFIIESGLFRVTCIYYNSRNPNSVKNLELFIDKYLQKYVSEEAKISLLIKEDNSLSFKNHKINPYNINLNTMYNESFLSVHSKIKNDITNTNKGLILLHGIAGSGKTNYIKWLTSQIPEKNFIFIPNNMIQVLTEPSFINLLLEKKNSVIVLEDCENYISERSSSTRQGDEVASILNITDGLLSDILECQFICTFNAKITAIDHALLRKGRLIAEYYFDKLSIERCNAYLKSVDKNFEVDKPYSLAEIVHIDKEEFISKKKKRIGF